MGSKLARWLPALVAAGALVVVFVQRSEVTRLQRRLARLEGSGAGTGQGAAESVAPRTSGGAAGDVKLNTRRIAALERTVSRLASLLLAGQAGKGGKGGKAVPVPGKVVGRLTNLREDVDALLTGEALKTAAGRKRLHELVRQAQQQARQERRERWRKAREELFKERLDRFAKEVNLSGAQKEQLRQLLDGYRQKRRAMWQAASRGEKSYADAIRGRRALRKQIDQQVQQMLTADQYKRYKESFGRRGRRH